MSKRRVTERRRTEPSAVLLHRLWTKAVGTAGYVKREWLALAAYVESREQRRSDRRQP